MALSFAQKGAKVTVADCSRSTYISGKATVNVIKDVCNVGSFVFAKVSRATDAENL